MAARRGYPEDEVALGQCPSYNAVLPGGEVNGSIQQELEVGLAPLTTTLNDMLGEFVLPCPCTLHLLGPGPQRENASIRAYGNGSIKLLRYNCSLVAATSAQEVHWVVGTPLPNFVGKRADTVAK